MTIRSLTGAAGALALALALTTPGAAEAQEGFEFEVRGGMGLSGGDHGTLYDSGYGGGLAGIWWLKDRWGLRIDADLYKYTYDEDVEIDPALGDDFPDSRLFSAHLGTGVKLLQPEESGVLLELNAGAGLTVFDSGDLGGDDAEDVNDPFFSVGGGAQLGFPVGPVVLGVDARLRHVFSDPDTLCPMTQYVVEFGVDPATCAADGPSSVDAMDRITAYPISIFLRFGHN